MHSGEVSNAAEAFLPELAASCELGGWQRAGSMPSAQSSQPALGTIRSLSVTDTGHMAPHAVPHDANSQQPRHPEWNYNSLDQFSCRVEIYKGSVSTVYKGVDDQRGLPVVIKAYHKAKMAEKHYHKLAREVAAMRAMRGPYVVHLLGTFQDMVAVYLVMEWCEGGDLFKRMLLSGGCLDERTVAADIVSPMLQVLERMHAAHLMHRDIKPENIFLAAGSKLRLGDFGLAINSMHELPFSRSGTLDYMAPEVLRNPATQLQESPAVQLAQLHGKNIRPYGVAVDVWAVGVLAYELVCGKPPFEVEDESQTASLIMYSNNIPFPAGSNPNWADFVRAALIKDPAQRPTAATLLQHKWILQHVATSAAAAAGASLKAQEQQLQQRMSSPQAHAVAHVHVDAGGGGAAATHGSGVHTEPSSPYRAPAGKAPAAVAASAGGGGSVAAASMVVQVGKSDVPKPAAHQPCPPVASAIGSGSAIRSLLSAFRMAGPEDDDGQGSETSGTASAATGLPTGTSLLSVSTSGASGPSGRPPTSQPGRPPMPPSQLPVQQQLQPAWGTVSSSRGPSQSGVLSAAGGAVVMSPAAAIASCRAMQALSLTASGLQQHQQHAQAPHPFAQYQPERSTGSSTSSSGGTSMYTAVSRFAPPSAASGGGGSGGPGSGFNTSGGGYSTATSHAGSGGGNAGAGVPLVRANSARTLPKTYSSPLSRGSATPPQRPASSTASTYLHHHPLASPAAASKAAPPPSGGGGGGSATAAGVPGSASPTTWPAPAAAQQPASYLPSQMMDDVAKWGAVAAVNLTPLVVRSPRSVGSGDAQAAAAANGGVSPRLTGVRLSSGSATAVNGSNSPSPEKAAAGAAAPLPPGGTGRLLGVERERFLLSTPNTAAAAANGSLFTSPRPAGPGIKERLKFHLQRQC